MGTRKRFLLGLGLVNTAAIVAARQSSMAQGVTAPPVPAAPQSAAPATTLPAAPAVPTAVASVEATSSAAAQAPSAEALAAALSMRRFDAALTDDEIARIARDIDGARKLGARLNPANRRLANSDEPVTSFIVGAGS